MTKRLPSILISGSTDPKGVEFKDSSASLSLNYALAIKAAGGMPWLLPCIPDRDYVANAVRRCDGVMLTGGDDVQPRLYLRRLPAKLKATVQGAAPERDQFEFMLIEELLRQRKPLLAICRGHQILNVALGGTLIVDIASQVPGALRHERSDRKDRVVHEITIRYGSLLSRVAAKPALGVNSSHHQGVAKVAKFLRATAESIDGIIEGLELAPAAAGMLPYLMAVQFHPERLFTRHAEHLELFRSFTRACCRSR